MRAIFQKYEVRVMINYEEDFFKKGDAGSYHIYVVKNNSEKEILKDFEFVRKC